MNALKKNEQKGTAEKMVNESISDEEVLSMQELETSEGGRCMLGWCENGCVPGCLHGCWWGGPENSGY